MKNMKNVGEITNMINIAGIDWEASFIDGIGFDVIPVFVNLQKTVIDSAKRGIGIEAFATAKEISAYIELQKTAIDSAKRDRIIDFFDLNGNKAPFMIKEMGVKHRRRVAIGKAKNLSSKIGR